MSQSPEIFEFEEAMTKRLQAWTEGPRGQKFRQDFMALDFPIPKSKGTAFSELIGVFIHDAFEAGVQETLREITLRQPRDGQ